MRLALRVAITVLLIAAVLWWIGDEQASGAQKISQLFGQVDPWFLALGILVSTVDRALMAFKWKLLLRSRGLELRFLRALKIYCTALVWGLFLPSTVGADALRAAMTIRTGLPGNDVIASIVVERMVGFLCSLISSLLGLILLGYLTHVEGVWSSLWWMGSLLLVAAIGVVGLSFSRSLFDRLFSGLPARLRRTGLAQRLQHLHGIYVDYCSSGRAIGVFVVLTFAENFVTILMSWLAALALHVDVSLLFIAGAVPLSVLVSRLPLSIDGIGVFESAFAALMYMAGVHELEAVSIALLGRVVQIASWMPWWMSHFFETRELQPRDESIRQQRDPR